MDFTEIYKATARADILRLAKHCDALAGTQPLPRRRDLRPAQMTWILGRLYLIDVLDGGGDYSFRLFGIFWEKMYGTDLTGNRLSAIEGAGQLTVLRSDYDAVVAARAPALHPGRLVWPNQKSIKYERLLVPFSDDGERVSLILVAAGCDVSLDELVLHRGQKGRELPRLILD